jgi:RNA polymerase sigma factor (sigma-70 family)
MPRVRLPVRLPAPFAADDDRELLARFAEERDEAAFAAIVGRHARMVYGVCRRTVRDEHLAEDAFQAVFLVLAKNPRRASAASSVGGWLFGIARRVGLAARRHEERKANHRARGLPRGAAEPGVNPGLYEAQFDDLLRVLDEELAGLPEAYRAPLVACFLEERTQDEAAKELGWSVSTLRRRLDRAKELLRARLTRRGATLAGGLFAGVLAPSARAAVPARLLAAAGKPSALAAMLASEAVRGSFFVKAWLPVVAVAVTLGGLAVGFAGERGQQRPESRTQAPTVRREVAPGPRPVNRTPWVTVSGRVVFPRERDIPPLRLVPAGAIKDAGFFLPAGALKYGDLEIHPETRGLANAVVWLRADSTDKNAAIPAAKIHPKLAAKGEEHRVTANPTGLSPRIVAARTGDYVTFDNPTPVAFNVQYDRNAPLREPKMGEAEPFNVLLPAGRAHSTKPLSPTRIGDRFHDNIHSWITGYVWTFDHPYFAVTDDRGNFTIPDAPAGDWRLMIWHEKVGWRYGAKGRFGEPITIRGDGKMSLGSVVHTSPGWDDLER